MTVLTAHLRMRSDDGDELFVDCFFFSAFILYAWFDEFARIGIKPMGWVAGRTRSVFRGGIILCFDCQLSNVLYPLFHHTQSNMLYYLSFPIPVSLYYMFDYEEERTVNIILMKCFVRVDSYECGLLWLLTVIWRVYVHDRWQLISIIYGI